VLPTPRHLPLLTSRIASGIILAVMTSPIRRVSRWLTLPALALTLVACSETAPPIPVINPPVTSVPGQIPSQQPIATPTPDLTPEQALEEAERLVHNGNYEAAIQSFQALMLDPGAPPQIAAEANFGQGQAALRQGAFAAALAAFDNFLATYPDHPKAAIATFLRGDAKMGVADWGGAIGDFQTYLSQRPGLADSYAHERIGDAYLALGQPGEALVAYEQATAAGRDVSSLVELRERIAQIHLNTENPQGAIDQYQAILDVAQIPTYRAKIEFLMAQAYFTAGDAESGNSHLLTVVNTYPETTQAYDALQALETNGIGVDPFQQGLVEFSAEDYLGASESFYNWLAQADLEHPADVHFYLARSYAALGNPAAALQEYQTIVDTHEDDPAWGQAFVEYAGIQAQTGDVEGALVTINAFVGEYPDLPQVADAYYQAAQVLEVVGDLTRATDYYLRLAAENPGDERANEGLLQAGLAYFQANDLASAERMFNSVIPNAQGDQLAAAYLWLGRTYLAQGRSDEAVNAFNGAAAADPGGYYALRAADLQANRPAFQPPAGLNFEFDEAAAQAEAETWLVNTFAMEETPPLSGLRPDVAADVRMIRGQELWGLGLLEEARLEFESLREAYDGDPLALYQLSLYFRDIGLYRSSITAVRRLILLSGETSRTVPGFIARLNYPVYYRDLIVPAAEKYGLDPLFVFAIIRQESAFEGFVTSFAFAQGLMQIIPSTGQGIADNLGWPNYQNEDLYRPYVSVEFGTYYMDQQRDIFEGDLFAAMAAYNAGAGRVVEWQGQSGNDTDLFVEVIPFDETYRYVTFTYAQYGVYHALYGVGG